MDRRRRGQAALGLILALAAGVALAADAPPLQAMRWASTDADPVALFAWRPTECLQPPADAARARSVEIGRAAFRTPLLLGGQAARAGLSCESCHRNGRTNPAFLFPGASGAPGTADVTLSLFSSHRGNGVHDPKPIPDLSGERSKLKVRTGDLPTFIHGLIVEEFDGPEPDPRVLQGLADYVAALDPATCPAKPREALTLAAVMADARRAVRMAQTLAADDPKGAVLMTAAARSQLRLIDERFAGLIGERAQIAKADQDLADLQGDLRAGAGGGRASSWLKDSVGLEHALARTEAKSLFNPARLSTLTKRRLPREAS